MRRKEKRLLQFAGLLIAALLFLPNVGLWSLYKDRVFDNSPDSVDGPGAIPQIQGVNRAGKDSQLGRNGVRRKDWHDYEAIKRDASRSGNGEQGKPFPLTDADRVDQAYRENGFNIYVSDRISLNRSVPDIRHPKCYEVTEHVCRVVREQLSVWLLWGCDCFSTRIFLGGGQVQRMEKVGSLALFVGHSEATGKLNKQHKLKNPL